jgi:integrase
VFLSRRSGGFYYLWYEDEFGRRRKISTKTTRKPEAVEFLRTFKRETAVKVKPKRLSEFTKEFLAFTQTTYAVRTNDLYQRVLHLLEKQVGDIPIGAITTRHIDQYKSIKLRTVKPVSVNVELRALRAAFATAKRWKLITENPCTGSKLIPVPDEPPIFFTVVDFEKLIAVMEQGWLRELVVFAVLTGLRRGEICNLRWQDVDLDRRVVHVRSTATFRTKQGKRRVVALNTTALAILHARMHRSPSEYVFTLNDHQIRDEHISRLFKRAVLRAKLSDTRLHYHSVRHTFASWLVQNGASLYEVQKLLGHSNPRVTQVYAHLLPMQMHDTVNRISALDKACFS